MNTQLVGNRNLKWITFAVVLGLGASSLAVIAGPSLIQKPLLSANTLATSLVGDRIQEALNLTPQQTTQLEQIRRQAIENIKFIQEQIAANRDLLEEELKQPEPDLRKIVNDARARFDAAHSRVQANMDNRLALYDGMTTDQKQIVCAAIEKHLERVALLQQLALQLLGNLN